MIDGWGGGLASFMDFSQQAVSVQWADTIADRFPGLKGAGRIVDIGCGSGLLLQRLRRAGFLVAGIDSSADMIQRSSARLGGDDQLYRADLVTDRIPSLDADLAVCVNGVANCFADSDDLRRALSNIRGLLTHDGVLWLEIFTLDYLLQLADTSVIQEASDFTLFLRCIWLDDSKELLMRLSGSAVEGDGRVAFDNLIRYRYIDPGELVPLAEQAGLLSGRHLEGSVDRDRVCWEFTAA